MTQEEEQFTAKEAEKQIVEILNKLSKISPTMLASVCHKGLGGKTEMGLERLKVAMDACRLFDRKQNDYGSKNIKCFDVKEMNILGVTIRLNDKLQRLTNLTLKQIKSGVSQQEVEDESLADTATDICNYGAILVLLISNRWR